MICNIKLISVGREKEREREWSEASGGTRTRNHGTIDVWRANQTADQFVCYNFVVVAMRHEAAKYCTVFGAYSNPSDSERGSASERLN